MDTTAPAPVPAAGRFALAALPARTKMALAAGLAVLAAVMVASVLWSRQPDWRVLFANLSDRDGGSVIAVLSQMNVPYKHADGGAAILVPADKVHDVRLKLASQGLPKGGTVGFELMENQKFGTTQFQERLNFQRGLEGELARSIQALAAVASARVHLAMPNQTAFLREQQKPSASVLLTLHGGRTLDRAQVAGIVHLVASSVPELTPKQVSVIDQTGALLSSQDDAAGPGGLDPAQLQYTRQIEATLAQRVSEIVEPIVGRGNVRAQVTAEVDFTIAESTAEQYRPNQGAEPAAVRSQQVSEGGAAAAGPQGVPGALSNQPPAPSAAPINGQAQPMQAAQAANGGGTTRRDAVTNYEVDKTVRVVRSATGTVKRISAAVVVDHRRVTDPNGKLVVTPLSPQQIEQINALVRDAIGFSKDRGDSVNVVNAPFTLDDAAPAAEPSFWQQPDTIAVARDLGVQALLAILALVIVFAVIRPAMRRATPPPAPAAPEPERALAAVVADDLALPAPEPDSRPPTAAQQALQLARENPAAVANVVRNWMNGAAG